MCDSNQNAITAWNTVLFDKFERYKPLLVSAFTQHSETALDRHPPETGARVLDLGCGYGDTTVALARRVGELGFATGVDATSRFIDSARSDAGTAGVRNARFDVCDVQEGELGGPYDYCFSRFGCMFFANPVAAFRNVRKSLVSGARLVMLVWRNKQDNEFLYEVERRVLQIVAPPDRAEQVTCGPGPFSMADPDRVSAQLQKAGFDRIGFERLDLELCMGRDAAEALELAMALGPAGEILRLAGAAAEAKREQVCQVLTDLIRGCQRPDGRVLGRSSSWIVAARAA